MWGRVLRAHPGIPKVKIVDLVGMYDTVKMMPKTEVDFNQEPGDTKKEPKFHLCASCHTVNEMREMEIVRDEEQGIIDHLCTSCGEVVTTTKIPKPKKYFEEVNNLVEISDDIFKPLKDKLKDIDLTMKLSDVRAKEIISDLRARFAPRTKPGWEFYLWKAVTSDPVYMSTIFKGNLQGIITDAETWKEIMKVKDKTNA